MGLLGLIALLLITINTVLTKPNGVDRHPPGRSACRRSPCRWRCGSLAGDADVATRPNEGSAGNVPACQVRGAADPQRVRALRTARPVVLALFVDAGSCPDVLGELQALASAFPQVRFAAVAIKGARARCARLVRTRG